MNSSQMYTSAPAMEQVIEIPLAQLHPFEGHPFNVQDDDAMLEMAESIRQYGVLVPGIVRPDPDGGYEMIACHRRHRASQLAGKETIPVIVRNMDDDAAIIIMVDSNLQRDNILPSERAFAYRMKLDAMKHQRKRDAARLSQVGTKPERADELLAQQVGSSRNQVQRYIRLTELIPQLLDINPIQRREKRYLCRRSLRFFFLPCRILGFSADVRYKFSKKTTNRHKEVPYESDIEDIDCPYCSGPDPVCLALLRNPLLFCFCVRTGRNAGWDFSPAGAVLR